MFDGFFQQRAQQATPTWQPTDIGAALVGYVNFEDNSKITVASGAVSAISDSVAAGVSWAQGTASLRPTLITSTQTGRQVAKFDGVDDYLAVTPSPAAYPITGIYEWWVVGTQDAPGSDNQIRYAMCAGAGSGTFTAIGRRFTDPISRAYGENNGVNINTLSSDQFIGRQVFRVAWTGTTSAFAEFNGQAGNPTTIAQSGNTTRIRMGAGAGTTPNRFWQGEVSAIVMLSGLASDQVRNNLYIWAAQRLGIIP